MPNTEAGLDYLARKPPGGDRNKHTGGHPAIAQGDGCAGPYPEAPLRALGEKPGS